MVTKEAGIRSQDARTPLRSNTRAILRNTSYSVVQENTWA